MNPIFVFVAYSALILSLIGTKGNYKNPYPTDPPNHRVVKDSNVDRPGAFKL